MSYVEEKRKRKASETDRQRETERAKEAESKGDNERCEPYKTLSLQVEM